MCLRVRAFQIVFWLTITLPLLYFLAPFILSICCSCPRVSTASTKDKSYVRFVHPSTELSPVINVHNRYLSTVDNCQDVLSTFQPDTRGSFSLNEGGIIQFLEDVLQTYLLSSSSWLCRNPASSSVCAVFSFSIPRTYHVDLLLHHLFNIINNLISLKRDANFAPRQPSNCRELSS